MSTMTHSESFVKAAIEAEIAVCPVGIRSALIHYIGSIDEDSIKSHVESHIAYLQTEECLRNGIKYGYMPSTNWDNEPFGKPIWFWRCPSRGKCDTSCKVCTDRRTTCTCAACKK